MPSRCRCLRFFRWPRAQEQVYQSHADHTTAGAIGPSVRGATSIDCAPSIWKGPLRTKKGFFSTFLHTHDPASDDARPQRKIVKYDFDNLCKWGGLLGVFTKASVLRMSRSLAVCLCGTLGLATVTACVVGWYNEEKDMDTQSMDTLQQRVNITVTFILGFFVQLNLSRWWDHRSSLKQLHGAVADLLLFLASAGVAQEDLQTVARLGMLSQALLFDEVREAFRHESQPSEERDEHGVSSPLVELMRLGLLHADEAVLLDGKMQKAQMVWVWIARYALSLRSSGEHAGVGRSYDHIRSGAAKMQKRCCVGRSSISSIKAQLGTQLPFTYVQLIAMLVQCSHLVMAIGCGYTMAAAFGTGRYALLTSQVCQVILIPLTFQSLLDVCVYIHDPYGSDILDFSFLQYHVSLAKMCDSLITPPPASLSSHGAARSTGTGAGTFEPASSPVSMPAHVGGESMNAVGDCVSHVGDELTQGLLNKITLSSSFPTPAKDVRCQDKMSKVLVL